MKILFLDIDGVLNTHRRMSNGYCSIDNRRMVILNGILKDTGASLVISSAWRYLLKDMTIKGFKHLLVSHGLDHSAVVLGATVYDEELPQREQQILHAVTELKPDSWAVVDDLPLKMPNFVRTKSGLNKTYAAKVVEILNATK